MERGTAIIVDKGNAASALTRVENEAQNPLRIMRAITGYLVTATQRHIEREEGPDGKWTPLSPRTVTKRIGRRQRGAQNMLRVSTSDGLYASLIGEASTHEAEVGSNKKYARIHQLGGVIQMPEREQEINFGRTNRGPRFVKAKNVRKRTLRVKVKAHTITIPARSYLYLNAADDAEIIDITTRILTEEAK